MRFRPFVALLAVFAVLALAVPALAADDAVGQPLTLTDPQAPAVSEMQSPAFETPLFADQEGPCAVSQELAGEIGGPGESSCSCSYPGQTCYCACNRPGTCVQLGGHLLCVTSCPF